MSKSPLRMGAYVLDFIKHDYKVITLGVSPPDEGDT